MEPKCGRVIGLESSVYHSMTGLVSGRRCVLLISFTGDRKYQELAHVQAETLLRGLDTKRSVSQSVYLVLCAGFPQVAESL